MILAAISPATGPVLVACLLLVAAGAAKLQRPAATSLALARTGLPSGDGLVRALGAVELAAGAAAILVGGAAVAVVAGLYVAFALFAAAQLARARSAGGQADCGCFGDLSAPLDGSHVAINVLLAGGAAWGAAVGAGGIGEGSPGQSAAVAGLALVGAVGVRALLTDLPRLRAAMAERAAR